MNGYVNYPQSSHCKLSARHLLHPIQTNFDLLCLLRFSRQLNVSTARVNWQQFSHFCIFTVSQVSISVNATRPNCEAITIYDEYSILFLSIILKEIVVFCVPPFLRYMVKSVHVLHRIWCSASTTQFFLTMHPNRMGVEVKKVLQR